MMKAVMKQKQTAARVGFTIVELLIVVIVIGVIATIAIVGYASVTNRAKSVSLQDSLNNGVDAVKLAGLDASGVYPTVLPASVSPNPDTLLQLAVPTSSGEFCLNAYKISSYEVLSYDSKTNKTRSYLCSGVLQGSPVGGSLPAVPLNTNLVSDFSNWTLSGGATYNSATGEITLQGASGSAVSPWIRFNGAAQISCAYELYSDTSAPNFTPQAGTYTSSAYFGSDGITPVTNSLGNTTNGNAQAVPLSTYTLKSWTIAGGPNVMYARFTIGLSPSTWTSGNFKVRNPNIQRVS